MNKTIADWRILPPSATYSPPIYWNIPALYAGVVANVRVLKIEVCLYLADYYNAIGRLTRLKNPTPKPLQKFAGDVLLVNGMRIALETEPETILKLFENKQTAALLSRPVYDVYHNKWVRVSEIFH